MLSLPGHNRYDFSAIETRRDYSWPNGKRLAFYVALNIEHFVWGMGRVLDPANRNNPPQTSRNFAWLDYGNRVGIWRVFSILDQLGLPATILLNGEVAERYPELVAKIKARGDDVVGHGRTNSELLSGRYEVDEARIITDTTEAIAKHFGRRPTGWMGPAAAESNLTPDLLKEAGYTHTMDWPLDDQPVWMRTRSGPILSVPYPMELNDAGALANRDHTGREFAQMIMDQFDELVETSERQPLVMGVSLHGYIVGQPFRLRALREALTYCAKHKASDRVWYTRAGDIADYCFTLPPGTIPGS